MGQRGLERRGLRPGAAAHWRLRVSLVHEGPTRETRKPTQTDGGMGRQKANFMVVAVEQTWQVPARPTGPTA